MIRFLQLCLIIAFVGLSCSCAFKKEDQTNAPIAAKARENPLFHSVLSSSVEDLAALLKSHPAHELSTLESDGKTLLETALIRGNGSIVYLLLKAGASPFHKGSSSASKPYELMLTSKLNAALVGSWGLKLYKDTIIQPVPLENTWKSLQDLGMSCNDIITLDSFMADNTGQSSQTAATLLQNHCVQSLATAYIKEAIKSYIIAAIRYQKWDHPYMISLIDSHEIRTTLLQFTSNNKSLKIGIRALLELSLKYSSSEEKKKFIAGIIGGLPKNVSSQIEYTLDTEGPIATFSTYSDSWIAPPLQEQLIPLIRSLESIVTPMQEYPWLHRTSLSASSPAGEPVHEGAGWTGTF